MKKAHPEYQKDLPVKKGAVSIHCRHTVHVYSGSGINSGKRIANVRFSVKV